MTGFLAAYVLTAATLSADPETQKITFQVCQHQADGNGAPIPNATVKIEDGKTPVAVLASGVTDGNGFVTLEIDSKYTEVFFRCWSTGTQAVHLKSRVQMMPIKVQLQPKDTHVQVVPPQQNVVSIRRGECYRVVYEWVAVPVRRRRCAYQQVARYVPVPCAPTTADMRPTPDPMFAGRRSGSH